MKNKNDIEIKACCASCQHRVINNDGRVCSQIHGRQRWRTGEEVELSEILHGEVAAPAPSLGYRPHNG